MHDGGEHVLVDNGESYLHFLRLAESMLAFQQHKGSSRKF